MGLTGMDPFIQNLMNRVSPHKVIYTKRRNDTSASASRKQAAAEYIILGRDTCSINIISSFSLFN